MQPSNNMSKPRVGIVGLTFPGYRLGEELSAGKFREMLALLRELPIECAPVTELIHDAAGARRAGAALAAARVDIILAVITTFVPDHFIVEILDLCDAPVFLWCVERELQCLSLVCGPLITATLYELGKYHRLAAGDIDDPEIRDDLIVFARAGLMRRLLRDLRAGYAGGKNEIMFGMSADDYTLKKVFGTTTLIIPMETFYAEAGAVDQNRAAEVWRGIQAQVGQCLTSEQDGLLSTRYYLAARALCEKFGLDALSLNCFPHLKSKICLAVARLNDDGFAAACEGDLHATVMMHVLARTMGRPAFNGDFLRLFAQNNEIMFSHCGAGAFGLAENYKSICLQASIETNDGVAVCYPTRAQGCVTLVNLMGARDTFRMAAITGESVPTDVAYEGTPLRVRLRPPVRELLQGVAGCGAGHHWSGAFGDLTRELRLLCAWTGTRFTPLTEK